MPHIIVEYSGNLEHSIKDSQLLTLLHQAVIDSGLFSPDAVKARGIRYDNYILTDSAQSFLHTTVSILAGRTEAQRSTLSDSVFSLLKTCIPEADRVSAEIREMDAATYRK